MNPALPSREQVAQAIHGDEVAVEAVVHRCMPVVLGWCLRLSGPSVDPEDAAHDILLVVMDRLGGLRQPEAFPAWLFQITRKTLASRRRRAWFWGWLDREPLDTRLDPEAEHHSRDCSLRVQAMLDRLPQAQRQVLVLHDLEERSDSETAEILGISKNTVKSRLRAGRGKLRAMALDEGLWPMAAPRAEEGR